MLFLSIVQEIPQPPGELNPDVPEGMQRIIGRCLERDRDLRYQHASKIRNDFQRQIQGSGSHENTGAAVIDVAAAAPTKSTTADSRSSGQQAAYSSPLEKKGVQKPPHRIGKVVAAVGMITALVVGIGLYLAHSRKVHADPDIPVYGRAKAEYAKLE